MTILRIGSRLAYNLERIAYSKSKRLPAIRYPLYAITAFTFIEIMLAVIILTVGIIGIIRAYIISLDAFQVSQDYIAAISLAEDKMVEIKQSEIEGGGLAQGKLQGKFQGPYTDFNWETEINASDVKKLNTVKVTVFNEKANPVRKFSLISYAENKW